MIQPPSGLRPASVGFLALLLASAGAVPRGAPAPVPLGAPAPVHARRRPSRAALLLAVAATLGALVATPLSGQTPPDVEPARVLVLGTYHFANPGLDVVQVEVPDILEPEQQEQVTRVVEGLAGFRPTKVAVEHPPSSAPALDSLFTAYLEGRHELSRNETQQIGFRLARQFGHPGVHPYDHRGEFPFGPVMAYAAEHDPAFAARVEEMIAEITEETNRRHREWTVGRILRQLNDPEELALGHGFYVEFSRVGAGDTQVGADLLAHWYERNIRMFSNIQAVAEPGDRILVITGSSHAPILRELVESDPRMELVDPLEYLPEG